MLYYRKKESNKKHYFKIIFLILIILVSKFLPLTNSVTSNAMLTLLKPINNISSYVVNSVQKAIDSVIGTKPNRELVEKLQAENNQLKSDINKLQIIVNDDEILKKEFELSKNKNLIPSKVIALDDSSTFNNFVINKGSNDGVKVNDIVIGAYVYKDGNAEGALVGKVEEVNKTTSKVVSIMDDKFNLTFMHKNTNKFGVINGRFSGLLEGYMLDKTSEVTKDDLVVTSGIGGVYDEGILIGKVVEVSESTDELSKLVKIESPIDFKRIYDVFVMSKEGGE